MLTGLLGFLILIMKLWPATPVARSLHRALVEFPLELAGRVERKHLIFVAVLLFGGQAVALLGAELALVWAMDVSLYAEAAMAVTFAAATARVRYAWNGVKRAVGLVLRPTRSMRPRPRARRTKISTGGRKIASNDDDHEGAWAVRAA